MHFIGKNMLETILSDSQEMHISLPQSKVTIQNQIVLIINLYLIMILKMFTFSHTIKSVYVNCKYLIIHIVSIAVFAWEAYEHGTDVHLQADPTKLELLAQEVQKRKEDFKSTAKDSILSKYGGEEHLQAPPKQLLLAQTVGISFLNLSY